MMEPTIYALEDFTGLKDTDGLRRLEISPPMDETNADEILAWGGSSVTPFYGDRVVKVFNGSPGQIPDDVFTVTDHVYEYLFRRVFP